MFLKGDGPTCSCPRGGGFLVSLEGGCLLPVSSEVRALFPHVPQNGGPVSTPKWGSVPTCLWRVGVLPRLPGGRPIYVQGASLAQRMWAVTKAWAWGWEFREGTPRPRGSG